MFDDMKLYKRSVPSEQNCGAKHGTVLKSDEARLHYVLDAFGDCIWDYNIAEDSIYYNDNFYKMLGYEKEEIGGDLDSFKTLVHPQDLKLYLDKLSEHIEGKTQFFKVEYRIRCRDSRWIWIEDLGRSIEKAENGRISRIAGTFRNITERIKTEEELKSINSSLEQSVYDRTIQLEELNAELEETNAMLEEEIAEKQSVETEIKKLNSELEFKILERTVELQSINSILKEKISEKGKAESALKRERFFTDAVLDSVPGLLYLYDDNGNLIRWNKKHEELTGYNSEELSKMKIYDWYKDDPESLEIISKAIKRTLEAGSGEAEARLQKKDGKSMPMYFTAVRLVLDNKVYFTGIGINITDRKLKEAENAYLSYHDVLTGLYNRRFYEEEIRRMDTARNYPISIIMGDVNGLKVINDAFGHTKGDELLQKAAAAIQRACRTDDIVARWGGDEFIILLPKTPPDVAEDVIRRIEDICTSEFVNSIGLSIAFGCDTKKSSKDDVTRIIRNAEDFMYKNKIVKSAGIRNNIVRTIIRALYDKSPVEEQHSKSVSELCGKMGRALGFAEVEINRLKVAGRLHDIGKVTIDEGILNKNGLLNREEMYEVKKHPDIGYRIMSASKEMLDLSEYVLLHHERWDGRGYPKGLKAVEIPVAARIIALADAYAAMTSERPYRAALSEAEAICEIRKNAGSQFDPELALVFVEKVLSKPWNPV